MDMHVSLRLYFPATQDLDMQSDLSCAPKEQPSPFPGRCVPPSSSQKTGMTRRERTSRLAHLLLRQMVLVWSLPPACSVLNAMAASPISCRGFLSIPR